MSHQHPARSVEGVRIKRYGGRHVANLIRRGSEVMAIHLTPTELAREAGLERREVIEKCMEMGVPIFQGRIDKTLFLASLSEVENSAGNPADVIAAA
jgi:hypothetical protein